MNDHRNTRRPSSAGGASHRPVRNIPSRPPRRGPAPRRRRARGVSGFVRNLRRSRAGSIVVDQCIIALVLIAMLGVLVLFRPKINISRAAKMIASGECDKAAAFLDDLERDNYPIGKITALRESLALQCLAQGNAESAHEVVDKLPAGDNRNALTTECGYVEASVKYDKADYETAARLFYDLGEYKDSASRSIDALCAHVVKIYLAGDTQEAEQQLWNTPGAEDHIVNAVRTVAPDDADRLLALELFDPANVARMTRAMSTLNEVQASNPVSHIATGYRHTVGVCPDGTTVATGSNEYGQCNVSEWRNVTQVSAGAYHTVALLADGTVTAVGDNRYGQCDVDAWTGVRSVACNAYGTFALLDDGTVKATKQYEELVTGWRNVTSIAAGSYSAGCIYDKFSMTATHKGAQMALSARVAQLAVCGPVSAGVGAGNALVTTYQNAPQWTDLKCVAVSSTGLFGIDASGRVLNYDFRKGTTVELAVGARAIEIAASGTHCAVLCEDGRVYAFGMNDVGQCNTGSWQLK